jgi:hypothetical protein
MLVAVRGDRDLVADDTDRRVGPGHLGHPVPLGGRGDDAGQDDRVPAHGHAQVTDVHPGRLDGPGDPGGDAHAPVGLLDPRTRLGREVVRMTGAHGGVSFQVVASQLHQVIRQPARDPPPRPDRDADVGFEITLTAGEPEALRSCSVAGTGFEPVKA